MRLPDPDGSYAVFVGAPAGGGDHTERHLGIVHNNVADLAAILRDTDFGGFRRDHCPRLLGERDKGRVLDSLRDFAMKATDVLLVYLSGHAQTRTTGGNELFLHLTDTDPAGRPWWPAALPYSDFRGIVQASPARTRVVIVDVRLAGEASDEALFDIPDVYTLTSTSWADHPPARHTAMTGRLIRLLSDGLGAQRDLLTLPAVVPYLQAQMAAEGFSPPRQQCAEKAADLAVVRNRARMANWALPEEVTAVLRSPVNTVRRDALDQLADLYHVGDQAVRDRIRGELVRLADDDSKMVTAGAERLLAEFDEPNHEPGKSAVAVRPRLLTRIGHHLFDRWWISAAVVFAVLSSYALWSSGYAPGDAVTVGLPIAAIGYVIAVLIAAALDRDGRSKT
jgi:hypothetical protein